MSDQLQPIIIKKVIKKAAGHHGGAWKVAYADFVTAMMAFFLLMWLLNVTTTEQKMAISNYFDPTDPKVSQSESGAGGVMGGISMSTKGAMTSDLQNPITVQPPHQQSVESDTTTPTDQETSESIENERIIEALEDLENQRFEEARDKIEEAIRNSPELQEVASNLIVDITPEGLRIQVVDQKGKPMFPLGSATMYEKTKNLMYRIAEIINKMDNKLSIRGHTDSVPYGRNADYTNWELSTDRANASRRVLLEAKVSIKRLHNVQGRADTEHLLPKTPKAAQNRRISIILLKEDFTRSLNRSNRKLGRRLGSRPVIDKGYKQSEGEVNFP